MDEGAVVLSRGALLWSLTAEGYLPLKHDVACKKDVMLVLNARLKKR